MPESKLMKGYAMIQSPFPNQFGVDHVFVHSLVVGFHHVIQELRHVSLHLRLEKEIEMLLRTAADRQFVIVRNRKRQLDEHTVPTPT